MRAVLSVKGGGMNKTKRVLVAGVAVLTLLGLGGCFWIGKDIPTGVKLLFSDLTGSVGEAGEVTVAVVDMPCDGLSGLAVGVGCTGFQYNPAEFQVTAVEGLNGFVVLALVIDNIGGEVKFVAVRPGGGVTTGDVVKIVGTRVGGGDGGLALDKDNVQLSGACGELITQYVLGTGTGVPYFVKGGN